MQAVRAIVDATPLADGVRGTVAWCLGRLNAVIEELDE
jgi:hypothetical protein